MLIIKWTSPQGELRGTSWHVGEAFPKINARVVKFQADGEELDMIVRAMMQTQQTQDKKGK